MEAVEAPTRAPLGVIARVRRRLMERRAWDEVVALDRLGPYEQALLAAMEVTR